jgi:hypothetical protein
MEDGKMVMPALLTQDSDDNINYDDKKQDNNGNNRDDSWSYKIQKLLKNVGEKSIGYRWMHEQEPIIMIN